MASIAPGLDGLIAARQLGQQRQAQEIGILSQLANLQAQQEQQAQAREMRPLQLENLRAQIAASQAQAPLKALEAEDAMRQRQARGALSNLMMTGGYQGPSVAPTAVANSDAEALRMVQEAEAKGIPMGVNVPNPQNIKALSAVAFPQEFAKSVFREPPKPTGVEGLIAARDRLPVGDPNRAIIEAAITKQTTHAPGTNVNVKQESEFGKTVGKEFGEIYTGAIKAEFSAPRTIATYDRLGNLLSQVNTGKFQGTIQDLKAAAKAAGADLSAMGIRDDVAPAQATRQISNMLALELRNPAGGAGMPGALSDKDREFLTQSIPGIENDPGAIKQMIEYRKLLAKRDQEVGRMARAYRTRTGRFDEGFFDELRDFSEKNPLFPQPAAPTAPAQPAAPAAGARFLGFEPNATSR